MKSIITLASLVGVLAITGTAHAQSTVVAPNAYTGTAGSANGLNTFIRDTGNPRTGQLLINANQLTTINVGDQINGISFRLWTGATQAFPASNATWADYTINLGVGVPFGSQTTTFANNFVGSPTTVRSGSLTMNANTYTNGAVFPAINSFGPVINFDTPYTYTGGNLLVEIRHTGSNIVNVASDFLEVALTTDPGFNTNFWAATATGNAATVGALANFTVARLSFSAAAVPEPTTFALVGIAGALGLTFKRQWSRRRTSRSSK